MVCDCSEYCEVDFDLLEFCLLFGIVDLWMIILCCCLSCINDKSLCIVCSRGQNLNRACGGKGCKKLRNNLSENLMRGVGKSC